jgi:hypothetical protein
MAPLDEEVNADQAVMELDAGQRQKITASSRLDLAKAVLVDSARPIFESLGENLDLSYHSFGQSPRLISDDTVVAAEDLTVLKARIRRPRSPLLWKLLRTPGGSSGGYCFALRWYRQRDVAAVRSCFTRPRGT